jgi:hypothetical protein
MGGCSVLCRDIGLDFADISTGPRIDGTLRRIVTAGDSKFALVERSHDFTLVPWRPMLEKQIGKSVSGLQRLDGNISWTIGRERGLGL